MPCAALAVLCRTARPGALDKARNPAERVRHEALTLPNPNPNPNPNPKPRPRPSPSPSPSPNQVRLEARYLRRYGQLYQMYEPRCWMWEMVEIVLT